MVLGSPGSGKSVLSTKLAKLVNLPLIRLDDLYWEKNWKRPNEQSFWQRLQVEIMKNDWVMDGNYHHKYLNERLERANVIIYLDFSTGLSLWGVISRAIKRYFGDRTDLPLQIANDLMYKPQWELTFRFLYLVLSFKSQVRPIILDKLSHIEHDKVVIILKTRENVQQLLTTLRTNQLNSYSGQSLS